jgi:hypothetical protein
MMAVEDGGGPVPAKAAAAGVKLLTFESWVTQLSWHDYALAHPELIPFPLTDRSPCQDPFFDPFADSAHRRPLISGLCRVLKNFQPGDKYIYITRIDPRLAGRYGHSALEGPCYFAVAALRVITVWQSHQLASADFTRRQYVTMPVTTPYPPNLAFAGEPIAAAARGCAIVYDERKRAHLPGNATDTMWRWQYQAYHARERRHHLRAAECRIERVGGRECLQLDPGAAPVITSEWWGGQRMNVMGHRISAESANRICSAIATSQTSAQDLQSSAADNHGGDTKRYSTRGR